MTVISILIPKHYFYVVWFFLLLNSFQTPLQYAPVPKTIRGKVKRNFRNFFALIARIVLAPNFTMKTNGINNLVVVILR